MERLLLTCGLASSLLYLAMNVFIPMQWESYDVWSQTISELSAIDAPTRPLWVSLGLVYSVLLTAFGWGVWQASHARRPLRALAVVLMINGLLSFAWPPMHQRQVLAAGGGFLTDTMHIVWSVATVGLMMLAIAIGSAGFSRRFRLYSFATLAILFSFGMLTGLDGADVQANLPTPWLGVWQRICVLADMVWIGVLAITLMRENRQRTSRAGASVTSAATYLFVLVAAAIAFTSCAATRREIPVRGEPASIAALAGEWHGGYTSRDTGRRGSIWFKLTPGDDHAHGDVLMTPRDAEPYTRYDPQSRLESARVPMTEFLTIRFVAVRGGELRGELEPYWDPECRCQATTTFTGHLTDDGLRGTFVTELGSGGRAAGAWQASRRRTAVE